MGAKESTHTWLTGGVLVYYHNDSSVYPNFGISEIHTINYYDDYSFDKDGLSLPPSHDGQPIMNHNNATKLKTRGLPTGSKVRTWARSIGRRRSWAMTLRDAVYM